MAKKLLRNYTFTPGIANSGTIALTGKYSLDQLLLITNTTDNVIIYNFAGSGLGGSVSYNTTTNITTLTLQYDSSLMSSSDSLQIFYDDYINEQQISPTLTYQDPVEKFRVSNPQALIDTDFEYSLQSTKWESVQLQNNIPGIFQRANEPAFQGSEITSILPYGGNLTAAATSISYTSNGRTDMTTRTVGNVDDANYFISFPFAVNFLNTNYTGAYFGSNGYFTFGSGSSQYSNLITVDSPNIPGVKFAAADRRLYYLGYRTIGTAPSRTFIVRWEGANLASGSNGDIDVELRFLEGQNVIELHYENYRNNGGGIHAIQDGPGPSTTFLATWNPTLSSVSPYLTQEGFRLAWGSGTSSELEITVASVPATPFTTGSPVILKETQDTLYLDGAFLITAVPSSNKFRISSRSPFGYTGDQKTDYTAIYTGGFFSNAEIGISNIQSIYGTTRVRINFSSNHGLYIGSKLYVVDNSVGAASWTGAVVITRVVSDTAVEYNTTELNNYTDTSTLSSVNTKVYARNEGIAQHRYFDGGVQINPSSNSPNAQIIRQNRKYFRYQSGKGIQFSTGVLFRPVYDVSVSSVLTNVYEAGVYEYYDLTITTDQEHGFNNSSAYHEGARIRISGYEVTSGSNPYNGEFEILNIVNGTTFTVRVDVSGGLPTDTSPGGIAKIEVIDWNDAVVRTGLFDDQNGIFFEHDGTYLYVVKRSSTEQIAGRVAVTQNSSTVTGTNTKFLTQLKEEDYVVIKGSSYIVTKISSDTSMTISPDYRGSTVDDVKIVKTNDTRYRQDEFNIDPLDGTGPSGYVLNANKMQMVFLDYSWYGAGKIRWGIRTTDGYIQYIHEQKQNNTNTEAYMRTGNIPGRFEIQSKSKSGKLLNSMSSASTSVNVNEAEASFLPQSGTIIINNEYIEYTKGTLVGSTRTLNFQNRNIGGLLSGPLEAVLNDTWLSYNQNCSPSLSHWGVSCIMDGTFDTDKSYLFTAPTSNSISVPSGSRYALISIRLAPSVDYGIPGFYGIRNLINRSELVLDSIGLSVNGNFSVEVRINPENTLYTSNSNWIQAPNGSIAQYMDHSIVGQGTFNTLGDTVAAFFAEEGTNRFANSTYTLDSIRGLGNSILGGPNVYPDGPDVLTLFVVNRSGATRNAFGRITWTESQG